MRNEDSKANLRIIGAVIRRFHMPRLCVGQFNLDAAQARHARQVLRLSEGSKVEVFDDAGATAIGRLVFSGPVDAAVRVEIIEPAGHDKTLHLTVAAAIPKGQRADWMVEKLGELGVAALVPLIAARSIVVPQGTAKHQRWQRIATEAAKQSRRQGVMRIEAPTPISALLQGKRSPGAALVLSTAGDAVPIVNAIVSRPPGDDLLLFLGPEGGWTNDELAAFADAQVRSVRLTDSILRVETAAIAAAAVVQAMGAFRMDWPECNQDCRSDS